MLSRPSSEPASWLNGRKAVMSFCEPATKRMTVLPMHPGEFPRPLLQTILKQAGLSVEEFRKLL